MMNVLGIFGKAFKWILDPKNRSIVMLAAVTMLILMLLQQCNANRGLKNDIAQIEAENTRVNNNKDALLDTLRQYENENGTLIAEKEGLLLKGDELEGEYADLIKDMTILKKEKVKTIIRIEYVYVDRMDSIPVYITAVDSNGNATMSFSDSITHDQSNYRYLTGTIPINVYHPDSSTWKLTPSLATLDFTMGMNIRTGLFQDPVTKKIMIRTETDFPGITFTSMEGASIMDNPDSKKVTRQFRKPWSLGLNLGYGAIVDIKNGKVATGPYVGVGISYSPKWLQWGK